MYRKILAILLSFAPGVSSALGDSNTGATKTGEFEITFADRSPLSQREKLVDRLAEKDIGPDYELAQQPFLVYVPTDYTASKPVGIVVYMSKNPAKTVPDSIRPALDDRHLIYIVAKNGDLDIGPETGLSIDAVFNLKHLYSIDNKRVYLMGSDYAEPVGFGTPDIFTGCVYIWNIGYYRNIPIPGGNQYYPGFGHPPAPAMLSLAKRRVHVFGYESDNWNTIKNLVPGAMKKDGFEHVIPTVITGDQIDYTSPQVEWFVNMIWLLESVPVAEVNLPDSPASQTVPPPAVDEAARLLKIAQAYISSGRTDLAQAKLTQLVQKYPNAPEAAKAKSLLAQIQTQPAN